MAEHLEFKQIGHLSRDLTDPGANTLNAYKLVGRWANTDPKTRGLAELIIEQDGDNFNVTPVGAGADGPIKWPTARATPLANLEEEAGQRTMALGAAFELGFMRSETYIRINKGVLVIVLFNTFLDDSGRSGYVNREFYYRRD
jgi:hypothetical protein